MKILLTSIFTGLWGHGGGPVNVMRGMLDYNNQHPTKDQLVGLFSFKSKNNQTIKKEKRQSSSLINNVLKFLTFIRNKVKKAESLIMILLFIKFYFRLKKELQTNKYDLVHFHDVISAYIYLKYFYHRYKYPNILTIQSVGPFYLEFPMFSGGKDIVSHKIQQWEKYALLHCQIIVFPSNGAHKKYLDFSKNDQKLINKLNSNNIKIIHNGIDVKFIDSLIDKPTQNKIKKRFSIKNNEKIIITVARYIYSKGVDQIPSLAKKLQPIGYKFLIVGFGELKKDLEEAIIKLKLKNLKLIPPLTRKETINLIKISDVFFMPSRYTVFDIVMLEALYLKGAISLASSIPGHTEMIKNNYNGFLSTRQNYFESIVKIINLKDREKQVLRNNGYSTVINNFSVRVMVSDYLSLYHQIIN